MNKTSVAQQAKTASILPPARGMLQRKCACGNHTVAGGECAVCAKKKNGLQRKLAIGADNDLLEQEADRVADQVLAAPAHSPVSDTPPRIQRYAGQAIEGMDTAPASVDRVLAGPGRPLEPTLRLDMEQRFGHDFSQVRVHTGGAAEQSAGEVNAHAYTVGQDIVFGAGRFAPGTQGGRRLLAHELTHVVQQTGTNQARVDQSNEKRGLSSISVLRQGFMSETMIQREIWFRGEGIGIPRFIEEGKGEPFHDLGDGLYLSDRPNVGARYALERGGKPSAEGTRLLAGEIPDSSLGRVLDLTKDPRWEPYVENMRAQGAHVVAGKQYGGVFRSFLYDNQINLELYDAVIGPEYRLGGRQLCIRNAAVQELVLGKLRSMPVLADLPTEALGPTGGVPEAIVVGTRSKILNIIQEGALTVVDIEISAPDDPKAATRQKIEQPGQASVSRMAARLSIGADGKVTAIEVLEGPPASVESFARQIAANLSASVYSKDVQPTPSGGGNTGGTALTSEPNTAGGANQSSSGASGKASGKKLSGEGGGAFGLGAAMAVEALAHQWIGYVDELNKKKAEDAVGELWPDISIELNNDHEMGAVVWQIFSKPKLGGAATFVDAGWVAVTGLTFETAKVHFDEIDFIDAPANELEVKTTYYAWVPPLDSLDRGLASKGWEKEDIGEGWLGKEIDEFWNWLTRGIGARLD